MLHVERRGDVSLSFIRLRRGLRGSHPKCIGVFSNRLGQNEARHISQTDELALYFSALPCIVADHGAL